MTPDQEKRRLARRGKIAKAVQRAGYSAAPKLAQSAAEDLRKATPPIGHRADGRALDGFGPDDRQAPTVKTHVSTRYFRRFGTMTTRGRVIQDPAVAFSYYVRNKLAGARYAPGVCRLIDPVTGQVRAEIDPLTRKIIVREEAPPRAD